MQQSRSFSRTACGSLLTYAALPRIPVRFNFIGISDNPLRLSKSLSIKIDFKGESLPLARTPLRAAPSCGDTPQRPVCRTALRAHTKPARPLSPQTEKDSYAGVLRILQRRRRLPRNSDITSLRRLYDCARKTLSRTRCQRDEYQL